MPEVRAEVGDSANLSVLSEFLVAGKTKGGVRRRFLAVEREDFAHPVVSDCPTL
jgi:hypothetical protein